LAIPPGFEAEIQELEQLTLMERFDKEAPRRQISLIEGMLQRLGPGQFPAFQAALLGTLGNAYGSLRQGDREANVKQAIACYEQALRLGTPEADPFFYATAQNNLGNAYGKLREGDREANVKQAIACYEQALRFRTPEANPLDYASTQHNLGTTYARMPMGDRAANLKKAIACYERALRFRTPQANPLHYASTQHSLAEAYRQLREGDRAANLRKAIACYEQALRFCSLEIAPFDYATTRAALGVAYCQLGEGDRVSNVKKAIDCFEQALRVFTPEVTPTEYAKVSDGLGIAYGRLWEGDRVSNLKKAVAHFEQALRLLTPKAEPFGYAMTQSNLGVVYAELPGAGNLQKAIACFEAALTIYPPEADPFEYARTQCCLGGAYHLMKKGDRAANLEKAVACYEAALTIFTPEADPVGYAEVQFNLGVVYGRLREGDRASNLKKAIACFEQALRFVTPESDPEGCRRAAYGLGDLYFGECQWDRARAFYIMAVTAAEARYRSAATDVSRQAELAVARDLFPNLAFCLARLGEYNAAVERLEAGKARGLAEALASDRTALDDVQPRDRVAFEAVRGRIKSLEMEARAMRQMGSFDHPRPRSFTEISDELRVARYELDSVIEHIRTYQSEFMPPGLDFEAIAAAVAPDYPLVYLITTSQGSLAFIIPPGTKTLETNNVIWLDEFRSDDLMGLLVRRDAEGEINGGYLVGQVQGVHQELMTGLDLALPALRDRLVGPLAARLVESGFRRASLVPGGWLSLLPLHATGLDTVTFAYAPSARVLQAARAAARERAEGAPMLLAIGNPLPNPRPIAFARTEVEEIARHFPVESRHVLAEHEATRAATAEALPGATHLHLSCHGTFVVTKPLDSALCLSGDDRLVLRDFLDGALDLSAIRLAVLSACQTGIVDFNRVADEAIGFPAGFIQAGVPGVVSTLWPVDDLSTAILMSRFYVEHLANGLDPPSALRRAQDWLRTATARDMLLADRYERRYQESGGRNLGDLRDEQHFRANPEARPFTHPYYWAGFTFTGFG
jgi:CHAT domain-containing protein/tetratricopeptide (TPR) repeat protein